MSRSARRERPAEFVMREEPPFTYPEIRDFEDEVTGRRQHIDLQAGYAVVETPEHEWTYRGKVTFCGACGVRLTDKSLQALRVLYADHCRHCEGQP